MTRLFDQDFKGTRDVPYTTHARASTYALHEYAGFQYRVWLNSDNTVKGVEAIEGQHRAASKDKHLRAARETFEQERKRT